MTFQELMDVSVNNPVVYGELLRQLSKRVTPVIGAGLSAWAKYPLWGKLIENLADGTDCKQEVADHLSKEEYENAASCLENFYGHNKLMDILAKEFDKNKLYENKRPEYQKLLPKLFKGPFVTTNFDVSLEKLLRNPFTVNPQVPFDEEDINRRLQCYERFLIKLHGTIKNSDLVFTKESYDLAYGEDEKNPDETKSLPQYLKLVFQIAPPLFLGCSLGNDRTCKVFKKCRGLTAFALLGKTEENFDERCFEMKAMGVKVIWYPKGCHDAVEVLIRQLATDIGIDPNMPDIDEKMAMQERQYKNSRHFLGRNETIEEIFEYMNNPNIPAVIINGPPGIGKTEICKAVYWRLKDKIPDFSMPFIDLAGLSADDMIPSIAKELGIFREDVSQEPPFDILYSFLTDNFQGKKCFVYLDNFETVWTKMESADCQRLLQQLTELTNEGLKLLISSQTNFNLGKTVTVRTLDHGQHMETMSFEQLCETDGGKLFLKTLGRKLRTHERNSFISLIREMDGHPLSIVLTATCCREEFASIDDAREWSTIELPFAFDGRNEHKSLSCALELLWKQVKDKKSAVFIWALHTYSIYPLDDNIILALNKFAGKPFSEKDLRDGRNILWKCGLMDMMDDGKAHMLLYIKKCLEKLADTEDCKAETERALSAWVTWCYQLLEPGNNSNFNKELYLLPQCDSIANQCQKKGKIDEWITLTKYKNKYQFNPDMNLSNKNIWTLSTLPF